MLLVFHSQIPLTCSYGYASWYKVNTVCNYCKPCQHSLHYSTALMSDRYSTNKKLLCSSKMLWNKLAVPNNFKIFKMDNPIVTPTLHTLWRYESRQGWTSLFSSLISFFTSLSLFTFMFSTWCNNMNAWVKTIKTRRSS